MLLEILIKISATHFRSSLFKMKLNPDRIERKTHTIEKKNPQHNQLWEWEETPELRAFIQRQATQQLHEDIKDGTK